MTSIYPGGCDQEHDRLDTKYSPDQEHRGADHRDVGRTIRAAVLVKYSNLFARSDSVAARLAPRC